MRDYDNINKIAWQPLVAHQVVRGTVNANAQFSGGLSGAMPVPAKKT